MDMRMPTRAQSTPRESFLIGDDRGEFADFATITFKEQLNILFFGMVPGNKFANLT